MRRSLGAAMLVTLVPVFAACAPDPAEQDFLNAYDELILDQPGYPEDGVALNAGRTSCHVMVREDNAQEAVDAATRSVADQLDVDGFLSGLVIALAAETPCPQDAPAGFLG